jgi:hypothetical protein
MDLVFVDGCHHYEAVMSDTTNALEILKPGGLLIWHDFANSGDYHDVTRAILDVLPAEEIFQIEDTQLAFYWPNHPRLGRQNGKVRPEAFVPSPVHV